MIRIDSRSDVPVHVQLAVRIRYLIANGDIRKGERLPATRTLADQLGISFHTVRRAYQDLAADGMVESRAGSGFTVLDPSPLGKSDRMERGARILNDALQQLVGLGLDESEIDYLMEEQKALLETDEEQLRVVVAAAYRELAQACADSASVLLQRTCEAVLLSELDAHADADYLLVPFRNMRSAMSRLTGADVIGIQYEMDDHALSAISRLLENETLGLVTRHVDAIGPLTTELRALTRFSGQVMAMSVEEGETNLGPLIKSCELLVYTSGAHRRIRPYLDRAKSHRMLGMRLSASSIERIRNLVR